MGILSGILFILRVSLLRIFDDTFGIIFDYFGLFRGIFGFFWEDFLRRIFWGGNSFLHFDMEEIDLFVKILVFAKILSKSRRTRI